MFFKKSKNIDDKVVKKASMELAKGSAQAFHLLYHKYKNDVYRYCYRILNDKNLADDVFQETFIKVYENREYFNGDNFKAWVITIARNTCYNYFRKKKDEVEFDDSYIGSVNDVNTDFALKDLLGKAIDSLPLKFREVIILREYEDYSYQEIAEILDIDISLVKVRIHRARLLLKEKLEPLVKEIYESR